MHKSFILTIYINYKDYFFVFSHLCWKKNNSKITSIPNSAHSSSQNSDIAHDL